MKKPSILKLSIIVGFLSIGSSAFAGGVAFGSANIPTCDVYGGRDLSKEAAQNAKINADDECQVSFGGEEAEITEVQVIDSYRGSCWAGTNSGVTVKIIYVCKY